MSHKPSLFDRIELSAVLTIIGIIFLFSFAVGVTLLAPRHIDSSWVSPTSPYQVQMYEVADPHLYLSVLQSGGNDLQAVYHLKEGYSLLAFQESETVRFIAPPHLLRYITRFGDPELKLTSHLILLRKPKSSSSQKDFDAVLSAETMRQNLQGEWENSYPDKKKKERPAFTILELFEPGGEEAFAVTPMDRILEDWVDSDYRILDESVKQPWHADKGVIYVNNPTEYRVSFYRFSGEEAWKYDPDNGKSISSLQDLESHPLGFKSRKELIAYGEHLFAIEGCWYCHTDQTRTLVQDVVLNGSESFPAPPSSANEYIYQKISFLGTRRIGPDISRVGVKKPSRDWHQAHFWSPKTASRGSIMPAFQHFFDSDPRGTAKKNTAIPNEKFEAVFQYLMTKGTRITPPTKAWWLGKDPVLTKEIIEGKKSLK